MLVFVHNSNITNSQVNLQGSQQPNIFHPKVSCSQLIRSSVTNTTNGFPDSFIEKKSSSYGAGAEKLDTDSQIPSASDAFDPISNAAVASPSDQIGRGCPYNRSGNFSSIIHRSRSRQKALELRNSSKKGSKYDSKEDVDKNTATDAVNLSKSPADLVSSHHINELLELAKSSGTTDDNNLDTVDGMNHRRNDKTSPSYAGTHSNFGNSIIPNGINKISHSGRMRQSSCGSIQPSDNDDQSRNLSSPRNLRSVVGEQRVCSAKPNAENEEHSDMYNSSNKIIECADPHTEFVFSHNHGQGGRGSGSFHTINDLVEAHGLGECNAPCLTETKNLESFHNENNELGSMVLNFDHSISNRSFGNCRSSNSRNLNLRSDVPFVDSEEISCTVEHSVPTSTSCHTRVSRKHPDFNNESSGIADNTMCDGYVSDKINSYCGRITRSRSCRLKKSDGNIGSPVKPASEIILSNKSPRIKNSEDDYMERKTKSSNFIEIGSCNTDLSDNIGACNLIKEARENVSTGECVISDFMCNSTERRHESNEQLDKENVLEGTSPVSIDGALDSCNSGRSPCHVHLNKGRYCETVPLSETSIMRTEDNGIEITGYDINLDVLDLPNSVMERASVLEQICRSASMHSPISQFPTLYKSNGMPNLGHSRSNEIIEGPCESNHETEEQLTELYAMNSPFPDDGYSVDNNKPCTSPVRKLWNGGNSLFSSEKTKMRRSFNPNRTCFPIEEEGNGNIDEVIASFQEGKVLSSVPNISKGDFVTEITDQCTNSLALLTDTNRESAEYLNVETSFNPPNDEVRKNIEDDKNRKHTQMKGEDHKDRKHTRMKEGKHDRFLSVGPGSSRRKRESHRNRISKQKLSRNTRSLKNKSTTLLDDPKHNNIIHNITSFVPFVHQKQTTTAFTGKRDIKVKALEAAEAARRIEEKKEIERKMKKEALKLERARLDQKKKLEIKKKEELKRKDTIAATNKRKREAGVSREQKRNHTEDAKTLGKGDKKLHLHNEDLISDERENVVGTGMTEAIEKEMIRDIDLIKTRLSTSGDKNSTTMLGDCKASLDCQDGGKVIMEMSDVADEPSYELSPYRGSEDEEDDETPNRKLIPSWASKKNLARVMAIQQVLDPKMVFSPESFCPITEVVLGR